MNPLAIFTGPYALLAKWGVIALLAVAAGTFGWVKGNDHGTQKLLDYQAKQAEASIKVIVKQGAATERVVVKYRDRIKMVEGVTTTIEKEVTKYVDSKPLALACYLDNRWVRLHNAAAINAVPPPAGPIDDTPGAFSTTDAIQTVTGNYAAGNRNADRLEALQGWVREQFKATNGKALGY